MKATTRLAVTATLITLVVLGTATATPWRFSPPQLPTPQLSMPDPVLPGENSSSPSPQPVQEPPTADTAWATLIITVLIALLIAALLGLTVRKLLAIRRERHTTPDNLAAGTTTGTLGDDVDLPELQDAVTRALAHLDGHARPRDAVVAAWVALEEAAARAGAHRDPAQTPTEFAGTVLAATPAPPAAVTRLRTLYQRARFTDRPIDREDVDQARQALADIAASLDIVDPATGPGITPDTPRGPA